MTPARLIARVGASLSARGLDLAQPFEVQRYNAAVPQEYWLPDFDRAPTLGLLVACTRAMWPVFMADRPAGPDPVDRWAAQQLDEVTSDLPVRSTVRLAHEEPPRRVAMQRLAEVSGLAWQSPAHLSIHPQYGPWIALRAALVFDLDPGDVVLAEPARDPCGRCEAACGPALAEALRSRGSVASSWQQWVAVRDACPVGARHRYGDQQLRYHYTNDLGVLDRS